MAFGWYLFTSSQASFAAFTSFGSQISANFVTNFLNPSSRSEMVLTGLGVGTGAASFSHLVGRLFFYLSEFLIVIGVFRTLLKKEFARFGSDYMIFSILGLAILVFCIVVPNFANTFRIERFYDISLLFLAPFFVIGVQTISGFLTARFLKKHKEAFALGLILITVIPLFFFETSFIYETTKDYSYSVPLSMYRMNKTSLYDRTTDAMEVAAALWLSSEKDPAHDIVYCDYTSLTNVLTSYGMMSAANLRQLPNSTAFVKDGNYVFLREINTQEGIIEGQLENFPTSTLQPVLANESLVYSNGADVVFWIHQPALNSTSP
jgi:uncharacterized membrane protein